MPSVNQPHPIWSYCTIKMYFGCILPQPRGQHVFGFFNRHAINMIDLFANRIVRPNMALASLGKIIVFKIQSLRQDQILGAYKRV